jgi:hypothetical protein
MSRLADLSEDGGKKKFAETAPNYQLRKKRFFILIEIESVFITFF